jgi:hypothetical protein
VFGVRNNPDAIPSVRGVDGTSWNNERLNFVFKSFQVKTHLLEDHPPVDTKESANILCHDVTWGKFLNDSTHFWPEVAVIVCPLSSSCMGEGLAWEPACK